MSVDDIDVIVHPESIIHSLVEFIDGSVLAQLSTTHMYFPISYALSYPNRLTSMFPSMNLSKIGSLSFREPDKKKFTCLKLAYDAARKGGTMTTVLNAANEVAVDQFLHEKVSFDQIPKIISSVMKKHIIIKNPNIDTITTVDRWAREEARKICLK